MTTFDMLIEIVEAVAEGDLYNDNCEHTDPVNPDEYCNICMIINIAKNASEKDFDEETTEAQREEIIRIWEGL